MLTLYHLRNSRSDRILWLLEELGLEYEIVRYDRDPNFRAPAEMREIHELGKSPILRDGELVIAESGAIVDYLVTRHGKGVWRRVTATRPGPVTSSGSTSPRAR